MSEEQSNRELSDEALDGVSGGYMDSTTAYKNYSKNVCPTCPRYIASNTCPLLRQLLSDAYEAERRGEDPSKVKCYRYNH